MSPYGSVLGYELVTSQPSRPITVVWPEYRTWFIGPCRLTAGRGAAMPAPARTVSGSVSYCRDPVRDEKQQTFYKCTQKCIISIPPRYTKPEFRGHGKVVFHIALEFSDCDEPFVRKLSESGQKGRAVDSRRWSGMTTRPTFRAPAGERDPCCSYSACTG